MHKDDVYNKQNPMGKNWGFTVHLDKLPISIDEYLKRIETFDRMRYAVLAKEIGSEKEKEHLQGYIVTHTNIRIKALNELLSCGTSGETLCCWTFRRRGTHEEMRDYCKHEGKHKQKPGLLQVWEYGSEDGLGQDKATWESSCAALIRHILDGKTELELMELYPALFVRYYRNIESLYKMVYARGHIRREKSS